MNEVVKLGIHRLLCGDATSREDMTRLKGCYQVDIVITDPPYGINRVNRKTKKLTVNSRKYPEVIGDFSREMMRDSWHILRTLSSAFIIWGGQNFADFLPVSCGWIFWDKGRAKGLSFSDGELAWTNLSTRIRKYDFLDDGFRTKRNIDLNPRVHPTQKPVELLMKLLEDFTSPGDTVLDPFGGSGATLIACELTGRRCLMMEISPKYCEAIEQRYKSLVDGAIRYEE